MEAATQKIPLIIYQLKMSNSCNFYHIPTLSLALTDLTYIPLTDASCSCTRVKSSV